MNLEEILNYIERLTPKEQKCIVGRINEQQTKREQQREKELWGNLVAAMQKYEEECNPIVFSSPVCDYKGWPSSEHGKIVLRE